MLRFPIWRPQIQVCVPYLNHHLKIHLLDWMRFTCACLHSKPAPKVQQEITCNCVKVCPTILLDVRISTSSTIVWDSRGVLSSLATNCQVMFSTLLASGMKRASVWDCCYCCDLDGIICDDGRTYPLHNG